MSRLKKFKADDGSRATSWRALDGAFAGLTQPQTSRVGSSPRDWRRSLRFYYCVHVDTSTIIL